MSPLRLGRRDEQGCLFALQVSGDLKTQKCSVSLLDKFLAAGYCRPLCKMFYIGSKIGDPPTSSGKWGIFEVKWPLTSLDSIWWSKSSTWVGDDCIGPVSARHVFHITWQLGQQNDIQIVQYQLWGVCPLSALRIVINKSKKVEKKTRWRWPMCLQGFFYDVPKDAYRRWIACSPFVFDLK